MAIEDEVLSGLAVPSGSDSSVSEKAKKYLSVLNPEQYQAVVHQGSPLLILAGAGSGKTRVITTKIAYLIGEMNVNPYSILAVTFTKKAAGEMQERAVALEERAQYAQIRTFHSFGSWFLRLYASEAGVDPNFTVYDDEDMASLLQKAEPKLSKKEAASYAKKISLAKDFCLLPDSEELLTAGEFSELPDFPEIYSRYEKRLRATGNVDFGDLILLPYLALCDSPELRQRMYKKFRVILVDEYQDSNVAQFKLLEALSGLNEGSGTYVCVVGDDDQSIYKFRGADVRNILNFQSIFKGTSLIRLESNYRSTPEILRLADEVVSHNSSRLGKTLRAEREKGKLPVLAFLPNQDKEVQFCSELIRKSHASGVPYSEWAILYRTNAQSIGFENDFIRKDIPYQIVGSLRFFEREEVKDILAYMNLIANKKNEIAFHRIVNKPAHSVGTKTQDLIVSVAQNSFAEGGFEQGNLIAACRFAQNQLSPKVRAEVGKFADTMELLSEILDAGEKTAGGTLALEVVEELEDNQKKSLSYLIELIAKKSGLEAYYADRDKEEKTFRVENIQALANSAASYLLSLHDLLSFLDTTQLDRTLDSEEDKPEDYVTLITLHNTKGLEFKRVVITGMEAGVFPRNPNDSGEVEEERRLCYVGITRAMNELYFTSAAIRRLYYGQLELMRPSPFLLEMSEDSLKVIGKPPAGFRQDPDFDGGQASVQRQTFGWYAPGSKSAPDWGSKSELAKKWARGTKVYHDDYGYGLITDCRMNEGEYLIEVSFNGGKKKFLPEYQKNHLDIIKD